MATTSNPKLRVMVDANVLLSGLIWPRWPYEVLQHGLQGDFQLVLSEYVISEARRRIRERFPDYLEEFEAFLRLAEWELIEDPTKKELAEHSGLMRDPADIPVALAAINAQVDCLVTRDRDFTDRDESTEELHRCLNILLPGTFLREHMGWTSEELEATRHRNWKDLED